MPLRGLILLVFILGSAPVCFFRPVYGIILWFVLSFLNPQAYSWAYNAFPWGDAVAIPTLLGMFVFERRLGRLASPSVLLLGLLWIWFTVTTLVSTNSPEFMHHAADTWERWRFVSKVLLMAVCTIPIVNSFERLRYVVLTLAGCFALYVLKAIPFIIATGGQFRIYGPDQTMIGDNNDFGLALNMTLPMFLCLASTEPRRWVKRAFGFMFVVSIPVVFFTYSRGALVGLAALFFVMLFRSRRRWALVPVIALAVVVAMFLAPENWKERMDLTRPEAMDASALSRLQSWAFSASLAKDHPIAGGGFATFTQELFDRYAPGATVGAIGPHSIYFQILAEHGYVGLALYLLLLLSCFLTTRRLRKLAIAYKDDAIAQYVQMCQFSFVAFLTSGAFLGRAYFDYFFTIVACVDSRNYSGI